MTTLRKIGERDYFPLVASLEETSAAMTGAFDWFGAVPDSVFKGLLPRLPGCVLAPRENHLLAMAFGARLFGAKPVLLIQNSGLGLLGDCLFGLQELYGVGTVMMVSHRGELQWEEPQHLHWGEKTMEMLHVLGTEILDFQLHGTAVFAMAAEQAFERNRIVTIVAHRGNLDETI